MSRRRHTVESIAERCGWALARLLKKLTYCPHCGGQGEGVHRDGCDVARAAREYAEWRDGAAS